MNNKQILGVLQGLPLMLLILVCPISLSAVENDIHIKRLANWSKIYDESFIKNHGYVNVYTNILDSLDISFHAPDKFNLISDKEIGRSILVFPNENFKSKYYYGIVGAMQYGPVFESENNDALILFPLMIDLQGVSQEFQIEQELIAAYGDDDIDVTPLIARHSRQDIPGDTNADSLTVYEYEILSPPIGDYRHCVALALRRYAHFPLFVKLLLNDSGKEQITEYIKIALGCVRYGNLQNAEMLEEEKKVGEEGKFPLKKYPKCKH